MNRKDSYVIFTTALFVIIKILNSLNVNHNSRPKTDHEENVY